MGKIKEKVYKYIYGPVPSWRLGSSLGIDLLSQKTKICTYDCIYCQLGATKIYSDTRRVYVEVQDVLRELETLPSQLSIDFITFSGRGEPTLASNLGIAVRAVKTVRPESVAVITNSSLLEHKVVRDELSVADFVLAKLDAFSDETFRTMNRPAQAIRFENMVKGLLQFKANFKGRFALQIMFTKDNKDCGEQIASLAREINPDEIQINTPLRPCATLPISAKELSHIKETCFSGCNAISVYESHKVEVAPISDADTLKRRGKT